MLDLDDHASSLQGGVLEELGGVEDRPAGHVEVVEDVHRFELGVADRPALDEVEAVVEVVEAGLGRGVVGVVDEVLAADELHERFPALGLDDDVEVVVGSAGLAAHARAPGCPPPEAFPERGTASPNSRVRVLRERPVGQSLLVAQLDPAEVQHRVLHGRPRPAGRGRCGCAAGARRRMAATRWMPVPESPIWAPVAVGGPSSQPVVRHRPTGGLRDGLVGLAVLVGARAEALARGVDQRAG